MQKEMRRVPSDDFQFRCRYLAGRDEWYHLICWDLCQKQRMTMYIDNVCFDRAVDIFCRNAQGQSPNTDEKTVKGGASRVVDEYRGGGVL